jgi:hypothetical protein
VIASTAGPGVAYATFDAHRNGDFAPYVFKTVNFGTRWTPLTDGLPPEGSANVIVEHPANPSLLFLGTEHALFVSIDGGANWMRFMPNLPTTLYDDLVIHPLDDDLVVGTHGRSIWILDDLSPLANWSAAVTDSRAHLFPIRRATILQYWKDTSYRGQAAYAGENPPEEAIFSYYLNRSVDAVTITVRNGRDEVVRRLEGPGSAGVIHRIYWDLRHEPPPFEAPSGRNAAQPDLPHPLTPRGPFVAPGLFTVELRADGAPPSIQTLEVWGDPMLPVAQDEAETRETFLLAVLDLQRRAWDAEQRADALRRRASAADAPEELRARADAVTDLARSLRRIRSRVYGLASAFNGRGVRQGSLYPPTQDHRRALRVLEETLARELAALEREAGD